MNVCCLNVVGEVACLSFCLSELTKDLDTAWAWMENFHQLPLTWLTDGLPDISGAVIPRGKTVIPLSCWHHQGLWTVCVRVCVFVWVSVCLVLRYGNNQRPFFLLLNTRNFAWCAPKAFTCRVGYKCGQTLGLLPRLRTLVYASPTTSYFLIQDPLSL